MSSRRCRTCPAIFDGAGADDQCATCAPCAPRSVAVKTAVPARQKAKARPSGHEHHGCEHYAALIAYLVDWRDDMDMCPVCGSDGGEHKAGCLLAMLSSGAHPAAPLPSAGGER